MPEDQENQKEKEPKKPCDTTEEIPLKSPGEVVVKPEEKPPKPPKDKKIHRRRPLPLVPEKESESTGEDESKDSG